MDENRARIWDLAFKGFGTVGLLISSWIAIGQYRYNSEKDHEAAVRDAQKPFLAKQLDVYQDLADTAATIATTTETTAKRRAIAKFWRLYLGSTALVVDDVSVADAVRKFSECLPSPNSAEKHGGLSIGLGLKAPNKTINKGDLPVEPIARVHTLRSTPCAVQEVEQLSGLMADQSRRSLSKTWNVPYISLSPVRVPTSGYN